MYPGWQFMMVMNGMVRESEKFLSFIMHAFSQIMANWLTKIITVLEAVVVDSNCSVNIESHHFQRQQLGTTCSSYFSTKIVSATLQYF